MSDSVSETLLALEVENQKLKRLNDALLEGVKGWQGTSKTTADLLDYLCNRLTIDYWDQTTASHIVSARRRAALIRDALKMVGR